VKFYATVTTRRVIEIEATDLEQAIGAADQQVSLLLPERELWKPQIEVSAVRGIGDNRYYVHRQSPSGYLVRERQLEYQAGSDQPVSHASDQIIRSFDNRDDAHTYIRPMNEVQRELDKRYGRWVKHAITPQITGEARA
jgi:hypothetical protein